MSGGAHQAPASGGGIEIMLWFSIPHITQISDTVSKKEAETNWFLPLFGGDKRDRTADLLNAIQALSQLSYTPEYFYKWKFFGYAV